MLRRYIICSLGLYAATALFPGRVKAQTIPSTAVNVDGRTNTISTAVPFLRISPDARSGAMGETGLALSADANAAFWNLSRLAFTENRAGVSVTYTPWLRDLIGDMYLASLSGYKKLDEQQVISASMRYFSMGNVTFRNEAGQEQGSSRPHEMAIDAGYVRKLSDHWALGIAMRYIYSNLGSGQHGADPGRTFKAGHAFAADLSATYHNSMTYDNGQSGNFSFGAALTNMGTRISYGSDAQKYFIPANLGIGAAYTHQLDEANKLTFALDLNKLLVPTPAISADSLGTVSTKGSMDALFSSFGDAPGGFKEELQEVMLSVGAEYWYNDLFAVRGGYYREGVNKGNRRYFTTGVGLKLQQFGINLSYIVPAGSGTTRNPLSNTVRFSLMLDLK
ncbi:type IX secretion system outer membrane channel protein PorV [Chitinophaga solisilvae]|uniref:type IX secretion system outer membrane channel protein PorV n=1 Tax=Chitinophaga solisilvae TaxID=1233460 RepID=UPI0013722878|nr:type IX secretion system outer membrane channel protein PorV [Chitinophaga solisilvae]